MIANINYGGRVTNNNDLIVLNTIIRDFINPKIYNE
jgi:hypothetical protein